MFLIIFILINVLVWGPWLWRYRIEPHLEKKKLRLQLSQNSFWQQQKSIETILEKMFARSKPKKISGRDIKKLKLPPREFLYGEIDFLSFFHILAKVKPKAGEQFYDLGSGVGKAIFSAALYYDLNCIGIELLPQLYQTAKTYLQKLNNSNLHIQFVNQDFLTVNFSSANIIFVNATALKDSTWQQLEDKFLLLNKGTRFIVTTKKLNAPHFKTIYLGRELMSWGMNSVHIYEKL